jgi:hypothetical protein
MNIRAPLQKGEVHNELSNRKEPKKWSCRTLEGLETIE